MSYRTVVLAALLAFGAPGLARADTIGDQAPYAMIRTLQIMQEQIAHGNGMAQAAQPKLLAHIAERFIATDPDRWREPRNTRAAILFLLSGGQPSVIRTVLAKATMSPETDRLLKGALAYAEGNDEIARQILADIEPRSLPNGLGGHLALIQASLLSSQDSAKAIKLLDMARLLVPGTLVEEAALRRQVFLLSNVEDFDKFVSLSAQYIRRYRASIYADNFKQRLRVVATSMARAGDVARLSKFEAVLAELAPSEQLSFELQIAKTAIVEGKTVAARMAAERAAALAGEKSGDGQRSRLYAGAALIVSDDTAKGLAALEAVDRSRLTAQDAELRDAAIAVGSGVRADPPQKGAQSAEAVSDKPQDDAKPQDGASSSAAALLDRAQMAVTDTDKLLGGSHP